MSSPLDTVVTIPTAMLEEQGGDDDATTKVFARMVRPPISAVDAETSGSSWMNCATLDLSPERTRRA